jgi:hypothetical protein
MSWVSASSSRTSTAVDGAFDVPVRLSTGSCSLSNRSSASCFGELMLNSAAGHLEDLGSLRELLSTFCDCAASARVLTRMPRVRPPQHRNQRQLQRR